MSAPTTTNKMSSGVDKDASTTANTPSLSILQRRIEAIYGNPTEKRKYETMSSEFAATSSGWTPINSSPLYHIAETKRPPKFPKFDHTEYGTPEDLTHEGFMSEIRAVRARCAKLCKVSPALQAAYEKDEAAKAKADLAIEQITEDELWVSPTQIRDSIDEDSLWGSPSPEKDEDVNVIADGDSKEYKDNLKHLRAGNRKDDTRYDADVSCSVSGNSSENEMTDGSEYGLTSSDEMDGEMEEIREGEKIDADGLRALSTIPSQWYATGIIAPPTNTTDHSEVDTHSNGLTALSTNVSRWYATGIIAPPPTNTTDRSEVENTHSNGLTALSTNASRWYATGIIAPPPTNTTDRSEVENTHSDGLTALSTNTTDHINVEKTHANGITVPSTNFIDKAVPEKHEDEESGEEHGNDEEDRSKAKNTHANGLTIPTSSTIDKALSEDHDAEETLAEDDDSELGDWSTSCSDTEVDNGLTVPANNTIDKALSEDHEAKETPSKDDNSKSGDWVTTSCSDTELE